VGSTVKVFLTGDIGHLGRRIAEDLKKDYQVIGFDIRCSLRENLGNVRLLKKRMRGCTHVIHCAALPHPNWGPIEDYFETNVVGSFNVMRAAAQNGIKRFVYMSSVGYYGCNIHGKLMPAYLPIDELHPLASVEGRADGGLDEYNQSKVMAEELLAFYGTNGSFEAISLRVGPANSKAAQYPVDNEDWRENPRYRRTAFWTNCHPDYVVKAVRKAIEISGNFTYDAFNIVDRYAPDAVDIKSFLENEYPDVPLRAKLSNGHSLISPAKAERILAWEPCDERK
jgi:UDP-glucose 4-epimerase